MRNLLRFLDGAVSILLPLYLIVISIAMLLPDMGDKERWFTSDVLPEYFDSNGKALVVAPLIVFTLGLGVKHLRTLLHSDISKLSHAIGLLGAASAILIAVVVYFTMRIDAFWINVPSLTAYIYARYDQYRRPDKPGGLVAFFGFAKQDATLLASAVTLYIAMFIVLATDVRYELINQNSDYLQKQMVELTRKQISTYQHQDACFKNIVSYQTNLLFQMLKLDQDFDVKCSNNSLANRVINVFTELVSGGEEIDDLRLQSFATLVLRFSSEDVDPKTTEAIYRMFNDAVVNERICNFGGRVCLIRMKQ